MLHSLTSPLFAVAPLDSDPVTSNEPQLLHEFFARAAQQWPDNVAIETPPSAAWPERRAISYAELERASTMLARELATIITGECFVAILLPRNSEHMYLAQLAAMKAGAAYVCIDPSFPDPQVEFILNDARPAAVLTDAAGVGRTRRIKQDAAHILDVVTRDKNRSGGTGILAGANAKFAGKNACATKPTWLTPRSLAYAIYTSGTTGRPKGVMIEHAAIANLVRGDLDTLDVSPDDRVGQNSSCAYDSSVEEIWLALSAGATLVVMDDDTTRLGPDLAAWLRAERITIFSPPPTMLRTIGGINPEKELPLLRCLHVGGEAVPQDVADRWSRGRQFFNDYGPTECTVTATRTLIRPGEPIHIGQPLPGLRAWVLNDRMEEVADGEQGELCIGGVGLARGYLNDPGMTARKFPVHSRFGRIYRTGDLVHRDADGNIVCHGRIDSQVKVRGYRIELEAIETALVGCPGVREAACRVQGEGPAQQIVAFIVPIDANRPPHFDRLKDALRGELPPYMIPSRIGILQAVPRAISGKLDRRALPTLESEAAGPVLAPRDPVEAKVAAAFAQALGSKAAVGVDRDFFHDLGGDSLRAAMAISILRNDPATESLAVRDLYETRTVARLAKRTKSELGGTGFQPVQSRAHRLEAGATQEVAGHPFLATCIQSLWLLLGLVLAGPITYYAAYHGIPELTADLGLAPFVLAAPIILYAAIGLFACGTVAFAVILKKLLIGKYRPRSEPVWGSFYVRNWMVAQAVRLIPWPFLGGTVFQQVVLRWLGARIGRRVHIHRGVNLLHGGWDLLDIGDDATIGRDVTLRLVDLRDGQIVVGPIAIGAGSTLDMRSGMAGGTCMKANAYLRPHSFLASGSVVPAGELWSGIPAAPAGKTPEAQAIPTGSRVLSPVAHGLLLMACRLFLAATSMVPLALAVFVYSLLQGLTAADAADWILHPTLDTEQLLLGIAVVVLYLPLSLAGQCLSMRSLGRVSEGVISRWSPAYLRVWLKMEILDSVNEWLNGTMLWRVWLRGAGMKIGRYSELSTIMDTVPELTTVGTDTFLADGIFLAGPRLHRGTVELRRTTLGDNVYLGNYAVIPIGSTIPDGVLLGVCTVADASLIRPGTSWFGQPPFELPKREILTADIGITYRPSKLRFAHRVFWEWLRFAIPVIPALLILGWFELMSIADGQFSTPTMLFAIVPALDLALLASLAAIGLALKWSLLGRVRPGTHGFWSFWVFRWDFHYTIWDHLCHGPIAMLEGTLLINWYLRGMGVKIGKNVVVGDAFAMVIDPDMISCADGSTVNALFQAHTFEDRVLKIDRVTIGANATVGTGATLLYGADVGTATEVSPHSVVMKHEHLMANRVYTGCPTRVAV
ncbi:MAG TPA: amino acid adenylation domain-containing protein [Gemmataceae bacterium]